MDLKCLLKLLLEKDIIKYVKNDCKIEDNIIMSTFEFEYEEVFEKIIESKYDKTNIVITKAQYDNNIFCVLNIKNFEKGLDFIGGDQISFGFSKRGYGMKYFPYKKLRNIINEYTKFYTSDDYDLNNNFIQITNADLEADKIKEEFEKKSEVLLFLSKLP